MHSVAKDKKIFFFFQAEREYVSRSTMITVLKIVADARIFFFRKEQLPFVAVALIAAETG